MLPLPLLPREGVSSCLEPRSSQEAESLPPSLPKAQQAGAFAEDLAKGDLKADDGGRKLVVESPGGRLPLLPLPLPPPPPWENSPNDDDLFATPTLDPPVMMSLVLLPRKSCSEGFWYCCCCGGAPVARIPPAEVAACSLW